MKRPAFQFYPKEWIWDTELRQCSIAARGLWVDLLCLMHEGEPYGHLTVPTDIVLRVTGLTEARHDALLAELEAERPSGKRVVYRTDAGILYSRRMVRDERLRAERSENGRRGGNPKLKRGEIHPFNGIVADFDAESTFQALWDAYPIKGRVKRPLSQQYYCEKVRNRAVAELVLAAVRGKWARSEVWAKGFVMALPEWINQERWNEEPGPAGAAKPGEPVYRSWKPPEPEGE